MNILVTGAGPTGLTAAIELARQGIQPTIIDKRDSASTLSRAVGITPRSLELLSYSGTADALIAEGIAMDGLRVYRNQKLKLEMELRSDRTFYPSLLCLAQDRTEAIMAEILASQGVNVRYGVQLEELAQTPDGVVARFNNGEEARFDHVIGADGIKSTVREQAGLAFPGFDLEQIWSIADVDLAGWQHPKCLTLTQSEQGVSVIVPIGTSRYRIIASHENALQIVPLPLDVTKIRREGTFTISIRLAPNYASGRIHLAGDAAHCHSPVGGRGMNLGIADAAELAHRMVNGGLESYSKVRHKAASEAIATTERIRKMSTGSSLGRRMMFLSLITTLQALPPLKRNIGRLIVEF